MKKVIVLGANGFLGTKLSLALAEKGCCVIAFVDGRFPYHTLLNRQNVKTVEFSLEEIDTITEYDLFQDVDTLYHFAWAGVNAALRAEAVTQAQNILYGLNVMRFAEKYHINKVIIPGSAAEVGCSQGVITGKEFPAPTDMYSASKVATRFVCQTYAKQHGIGLIWTLITSIYGPGRDDNNLLSYSIKKLLKGEKPSTTKLEQKWDYLHIEDLIKALVLLGEKGVCGKVYPIGSGVCRQMYEYIEIIRDLINPDLPIGIGDLPYKNTVIDNQIMDISELVTDTGFSPSYKFESGIIETINYFKNISDV